MGDPKDFPFTVPKVMPYSHNLGVYNNERVRIIACIHCEYQCYSNIMAPICGVCNHEMLTVVK